MHGINIMAAILGGRNATYSGTSMASPHVVSNVYFLVVKAMHSNELLCISSGRHYC